MSKYFSMLKTYSQRVAGNNKVVIFYQNKIYMTFIVTRYYILLRLAVVSHVARTGHAQWLFTLFRFSSDDHLIQSMVLSWEVLRSLRIVLGLSGRQQRTLRVYSSFYHDIIVILTDGALSALCGTILYLRDFIVKFYFPCYYMA